MSSHDEELEKVRNEIVNDVLQRQAQTIEFQRTLIEMLLARIKEGDKNEGAYKS